MSNAVTTLSSEQPSVVQSAERSVYINNENGGTVNLNYNYPQNSVTGEMLVAIQSFSKEYYQLIVTCDDIFEDNTIIMTANRALNKGTVPEELYQTCATLTPKAQEELIKYPAIICQENTEYHGKTDSKQLAMYAYIKKAKVCGKNIKIYYQPISIFPQYKLIEYSIDFGLNMECAMTDLNISRWTINKINLFEAFLDAGISVQGPI